MASAETHGLSRRGRTGLCHQPPLNPSRSVDSASAQGISRHSGRSSARGDLRGVVGGVAVQFASARRAHVLPLSRPVEDYEGYPRWRGSQS